jgi:site-specific recombinase XerD
MLEKSFGLFFFLKQSKNEKSDERYIYLRITVDGIAKEISLKRMWSLSRWDQPTGRAKGNKEDALKLNAYLDVYRANVYAAKCKLIFADKEISADSLKDFLTGKGEEKRMLLEIFKKHNKEIFELIGKDYAYKTYQKYRTTLGHTQDFIKWKYGTADLEIKTINYEFVKDLSSWLKIVKKCNHNSTVKYITTLKSILLECIRKKWLKENPFTDFKLAYKEVEIVPLYQNELLAIRNKVFGIDRLNLVRDIFVFSCYTGLAYVDVGNLTSNQIVEGVDGEKWIMTKRQKTDAPQRVPLLSQALEIIEKYSEHPKCLNGSSVLPILTNQKMNAYLKEIADVCGITKKLTFHLARHTFATTVTLSNGVPIETVSKMLGHKSLKQTQHYAKIVDLKISEDMAVLKQKLAGL